MMSLKKTLLLCCITLSSTLFCAAENSDSNPRSWKKRNSTKIGIAVIASIAGATAGYKLYCALRKYYYAHKEKKESLPVPPLSETFFKVPLIAQAHALHASRMIHAENPLKATNFIGLFKIQEALYGLCLTESCGKSSHVAQDLSDAKKGLPALFKAERMKSDTPTALADAFLKCNEGLRAAGEASGAQALMAVVEGDAIHIANVGRCQAILIRNREIVNQSRRDKGFNLYNMLPDNCLGSFDDKRTQPAHANPTITTFNNIQKGDIVIIASQSLLDHYTGRPVGDLLDRVTNAEYLNEAATQLIKPCVDSRVDAATIVLQVK